MKIWARTTLVDKMTEYVHLDATVLVEGEMQSSLNDRKTDEKFEEELTSKFGRDVKLEPLVSAERMGRRIHGLDLSEKLDEDQAHLLVSLLDEYNILTLPKQDKFDFRVSDLERIANHFGAPIAHPKNFANYRQPGAVLEPLPFERRSTTLSNQAFPEDLQCLEGASSPAVYLITNLIGSGRDKKVKIAGSLHWHTDIEFEIVPLSTSLFYVQHAPLTRDSSEGTWVTEPPPMEDFYHPDSPEELERLRADMPLNGETAYADTAAAYADLPQAKQQELDQTMIRRRLRQGDPGWLIPLVYTNPRTRRKSLHSPIWASRGKDVAPAQIEGLSVDESRKFFDGLEAHCLQTKYRYDHVHHAGDVTIWSNLSTLHNAPALMRIINRPEDARLIYRISCKGDPSFTLPRNDSNEWINQNLNPPYRSEVI